MEAHNKVQKVNSIQNILVRIRNQNIVVVFGGVALLFILGRNIPNLCTVWELGDEAGYLSNAAYFTGRDWSDVRAALPYYAYGYSVLLAPAFLLCKTGVGLIQYACFINILCVVGMYLLQIYIMELLFKQGNRIHFAVIAFITCLNSYLVSNALKVLCEVFLAFWVWILAVLLYKAVETAKLKYYCLLGFCGAYIFFIHTRGIIIIGTIYLVLLLVSALYRNKVIFKNTFFSLLGMGVLFILLYMIKGSILEYAARASAETGNVFNTNNLLTTNYISRTFKPLLSFQNLEKYIRGFSARIFYIMFSTGITAVFGFVSLAKNVIIRLVPANRTIEDEIEVFALKSFFLLSAMFMVLASVIVDAGLSSNFAYFFYNRYYEFAIIPLMCLGICECLYERQSYYKGMMIILSIIVMGVLTLGIVQYLDSMEIHIDTARVAGLSSVIYRNSNYTDMVFYATIIMLFLIVVYYLICQNKKLMWIYVLVLAVFVWNSTSININTIMSIHGGSKADAQITEVVLTENVDHNVYMIDTPYIYDAYYSRIQVLIKDMKMNVVPVETIPDISSESYIFTYYDAGIEETLLENCVFLGEGKVFHLYQKK